jgi:hypothetical protein
MNLAERRLELLRVLAFMLLAMAPGIDHDKEEDQEADSEEQNHPGTIFPYLLNSIRKLGPIHVFGRYTEDSEK